MQMHLEGHAPYIAFGQITKWAHPGTAKLSQWQAVTASSPSIPYPHQFLCDSICSCLTFQEDLEQLKKGC